MENTKKELIQRLKEANNVLVTVSKNPSLDQLSAAIGITLLLNKLKKHATAVFSGQVPSAIEFLEPEKTLEATTDSLRDFIIALDKSKADKLRYKIEDSHVKIFITPYRTSIGQEDLEFSQGDFNVDVVLALGVKERQDLDQAIAAHGRILHDATVASVNIDGNSELGSLNLTVTNTSSLCEVMASLSESLQADVVDGQMATAFLTGIVAETERFSNQKTSPSTMAVSSKLMSAGANQQLVATKLDESAEPDQLNPDTTTTFDPADFVDNPPDKSKAQNSSKKDDGALDIEHKDEEPEDEPSVTPEDEAAEEGDQKEINIDERGKLQNLSEDSIQDKSKAQQPDKRVEENEHSLLPAPLVSSQDFKPKEKSKHKPVTSPPTRGGTLTSSADPVAASASIDPIGAGNQQPGRIINRNGNEPAQNDQTQSPRSGDTGSQDQSSGPIDLTNLLQTQSSSDGKTLEDIEAEQGAHQEEDTKTAAAPSQASTQELPVIVGSQDAGQSQDNDSKQMDVVDSGLSNARDAVLQAVSSQPVSDDTALEPIAALNANPVNIDLSHDEKPFVTNIDDAPAVTPPSTESPIHQYLDVNQIDPSTGLPVGQDEKPSHEQNLQSSMEESPAPGSSNPNAPPSVPPPMMPPQL